MTKIQSIIENCSDCIFAKEFQEKGGNTDYVLICTAERNIEGKTIVYDRFLIDHSFSSLKHSTVPIPENCPLEDYKSTET